LTQTDGAVPGAIFISAMSPYRLTYSDAQVWSFDPWPERKWLNRKQCRSSFRVNKMETGMTHPPIAALETHLGYWLRMVSNQVSLGFAKKLEAKDVTVAEWVVMRELYDVETLAPSRLAERMGMTRGAISKLADRLIAKALIARDASPDDGRAQTLRLTGEGRRLVPELAALADANDADYFGHLSPGERQAMEDVLKTMAERRDMRTIPVE
jgi:DNA-binding MarR family transcriptional regulator